MREGLQEMRNTDPQACMCWGAMAGEGMTIPLWGAAVARPHPSRSCRSDSASAPGDLKPRGCVLHLAAGAACRCVGAVVAPGAGRHCGWVGQDSRLGQCSGKSRTPLLWGTSHQGGHGDDTVFTLCCSVEHFSCSTQLLWQPSAARPWGEGQKLCRRSRFYFLISYLLNQP